jgi:hypothetical protein
VCDIINSNECNTVCDIINSNENTIINK